jgi:ubiquinone/menaquinone biosynthesis C-methylase UbiE
MSKLKQKDVFLNSEGDKWFYRNKESLENNSLENDYLFKEIVSVFPEIETEINILEIGCGNGKRLKELQKRGFTVTGIDPSSAAIEDAKKNGVNALVGTADELKFQKKSFNVIIFGFCLYLCDREDLFQIASEANRVLNDNGHIFILDFYSKREISNNYHHLEGIKSYKMDYRKLFEWHPNYLLIKHNVGSHQGFRPTNDENEWVAISVFQKL